MRSLSSLCAIAAVACVGSHAASEPTVWFASVRPPTADLDVLVMVDTSCSMAQEQGLFRAAVPGFVRALASGDRDDDGAPDVAPLGSMHFAVITSDLGAGDVPEGEIVPSCDPGLGDDGIFRHHSRGAAGCETEYPSGISVFEAGDDPSAYATQIGCILDVGTGGCGFEQQLEVALKALSPASPTAYTASSYEPPTFWGDGLGHGDGVNDGFHRADATLAIVLLTDEEDCSTPNYELFYTNDRDYAGNPLNLRCSRFPDASYPIERYVDGFLQLRERPSRIVFAPIVGIPTDLEGIAPLATLRDPRMAEVEDTAMTPSQRLVPSCDTANGIAYAPRRIMRTAGGLSARGAYVATASVCADNDGPAAAAILDAIDTSMASTCLPSEMLAEPARCELTMEGDCDALGLSPDWDGGCVLPLAEGTDRGWFVDEASRIACGTGARVGLRGLAWPAGDLQLRCFRPGEGG